MPLDCTESPASVRWTLVARPFSTDREERLAPYGLTLAEMLEQSDLPQRYWPYIQVFVDDEEVPREWWSRVRPKPNARLFVRVNALGGGGGGGPGGFPGLGGMGGPRGGFPGGGGGGRGFPGFPGGRRR